MKRSIFVAVSSIALCSGLHAFADSASRDYVAFSGFYQMPKESDMHSFPENNANIKGSIDHKNSVGFLVAYGRQFSGGLALEGELAFRRLESTSITHEKTNTFAARASIPVSIKSSATTLMGNLVYTAPGMIDFAEPYIGLGLGVMYSNRDAFAYNAPLLDNNEYRISQPDDSAGAFAWQVMAGISIPINESISTRLGYRYLKSGKIDYGDVETEFASHNIDVGIVYKF